MKLFGNSTEEKLQEHLSHGKQLLASQFYDSAMVEFSRAIHLDREQATREMEDLYKSVQGSNDSEKLVAVVTNLLLLAPESIELTNLLANVYRKLGHRHQAMKLYKRCLEMDPNSKFAPYNLAALSANVDLYDNSAMDAISQFENMESFKLPDYEGEIGKLEEIQKHLDEESQPADSCAESPDENKESPPEDSESDALNEHSSPVESDAEESSSPKIDPSAILYYLHREKDSKSAADRQLFYTLVLYSLTHGFPEVAKTALTRLSFQNPENLDLNCFLALATALAGDKELGVEKLKKLLLKSPGLRYANVNLGFLYQQLNKPLLARKYYFITYRLIQASRGYYDLQDFLALGDQHDKEGRHQEALDIYTSALDEIHSISLLNRIGTLALEQEDFNVAFEAYQRCLRQEPENTETRKALETLNSHFVKQADQCMQASQWTEAAVFLEQSIKISISPEILSRAIEVYTQIPDLKRVRELKQQLKIMDHQERKHVKSKLLQKAEHFKQIGEYKSAIQHYQKAQRIEPDRTILIKMIDLCELIQREDLIEKITVWYNKLVEESHLKNYAERERNE
ncbi:MAG: tetratricopeptide repeat protein [SAR324 cluster bacterium]|nr:tetratricopeptide repeat protein [SAR324 cluster bacterium]